MTIQELKTREENRKKNNQLITSGRMTFAEVGENYKQKRIFIDGVDVFPFWERDYKEHLSRYDFLQLKEEATQRQEEEKRQEQKRQEAKKELIATLNNYGYDLRQEENENFTIYRKSDDLTIYSLWGYSSIIETIKMIDVMGMEYLDDEAIKKENIRKNENELKEKAAAGIIEWSRFGHFTDKKTGKYYTYSIQSIEHDFTQKGGFVNWIIKRTDARNEEERKEAEELKAKEAETIAILNKNGVRYDANYNAFYYKRSKVAQIESWEKIISYNSYYQSYKISEKVRKIFDDLGLETSTIETAKGKRPTI